MLKSILSAGRSVRPGRAKSRVCCIAIQPGQLVALCGDSDSEGQGLVLQRLLTQPVGEDSPEAALEALLSPIRLPAQHRWSLLLPPTMCLLGTVDLPPMPASELRDALGWRLPEVFGAHGPSGAVTVQTHTFDLLPHPLNKPGADLLSYWVWAAAHAQLAPWLQAFQSLKLPEPVVDCTDLAQRNLAARSGQDERAFALLSQGPDGFLLSIVQAGQLLLSRRFEARWSEGEVLAEAVLGQQLERLALEVQRTLDMFDRKYPQVGLSRLLLAPQPMLTDALNLLRGNLYLPVERLVLDPRLTLPDGADVSRGWGPLGALLRTGGEGGW